MKSPLSFIGTGTSFPNFLKLQWSVTGFKLNEMPANIENEGKTIDEYN